MLRGQRGARGAGGRGGGVGRPQPTIETIDSGRRDYPDPDFSKNVVKEGSPTLQIKVTGIGYFQRSVVYYLKMWNIISECIQAEIARR